MAQNRDQWRIVVKKVMPLYKMQLNKDFAACVRLNPPSANKAQDDYKRK
jgi:hypothetical protein